MNIHIKHTMLMSLKISILYGFVIGIEIAISVIEMNNVHYNPQIGVSNPFKHYKTSVLRIFI